MLARETARHWLRQRLLGKYLRSINNKCKSRQMGLHQVKCLPHYKETPKEVNRQPPGREEIFAYHATDIGLISRFHTKFKKLNNNKIIS